MPRATGHDRGTGGGRRAARVLLLAALAAPPAGAAGIGLIIDDLGHSRRHGERAVRLPGAVACAVLPHTRHGRTLAAAAHAAGKEVLLHLPMEADDRSDPGPGRLDAHMSEAALAAVLADNLDTVPHAIGVNNHMGSLFTTRHPAMAALLAALRPRRLFFVDSRTSAASVAVPAARAAGVPVLARDVFLDADPAPAAVAAQLARLERLAHQRGYALGIAHPYPDTLAALEVWLAQLESRGLRLIPLTARLAELHPEAKPWHASWSR